ncbi:MAG: cytochrome c oxidase subunit II [Aquificota bacterium]|nr:cytochrome c oxidase subunit II [Aquificota bacterium]
MDKAEKKALYLSVGLLVFFMALIVYASKGLDIDLPTCVTDVRPFTEGKLIKHAEGRYELHIVAKMWLFDLDRGKQEIEIPAGSTVDIYLTSADVVHGMHINGTTVNLMAIPGTVNYARYKFTKLGVYHVVCHEFCGVGHHAMQAKIVVK